MPGVPHDPSYLRVRLGGLYAQPAPALREQIEAMKSIERSIMQREERQRVRKN